MACPDCGTSPCVELTEAEHYDLNGKSYCAKCQPLKSFAYRATRSRLEASKYIRRHYYDTLRRRMCDGKCAECGVIAKNLRHFDFAHFQRNTGVRRPSGARPGLVNMTPESMEREAKLGRFLCAQCHITETIEEDAQMDVNEPPANDDEKIAIAKIQKRQAIIQEETEARGQCYRCARLVAGAPFGMFEFTRLVARSREGPSVARMALRSAPVQIIRNALRVRSLVCRDCHRSLCSETGMRTGAMPRYLPWQRAISVHGLRLQRRRRIVIQKPRDTILAISSPSIPLIQPMSTANFAAQCVTSAMVQHYNTLCIESLASCNDHLKYIHITSSVKAIAANMCHSRVLTRLARVIAAVGGVVISSPEDPEVYTPVPDIASVRSLQDLRLLLNPSCTLHSLTGLIGNKIPTCAGYNKAVRMRDTKTQSAFIAAIMFMLQTEWVSPCCF